MFAKFYSKVRDYMLDEAGVTAIEYGLMMGFVAGSILIAVVLSGESIGSIFVEGLSPYLSGTIHG